MTWQILSEAYSFLDIPQRVLRPARPYCSAFASWMSLASRREVQAHTAAKPNVCPGSCWRRGLELEDGLTTGVST